MEPSLNLMNRYLKFGSLEGSSLDLTGVAGNGLICGGHEEKGKRLKLFVRRHVPILYFCTLARNHMTNITQSIFKRLIAQKRLSDTSLLLGL